MPRRNRRTRSRPPRAAKPLTPAQLHSLQTCATEHLARHALCQEFAPDWQTPMTASEDIRTGTRFISVGADLDEHAVHLSRSAESSDTPVRVER